MIYTVGGVNRGCVDCLSGKLRRKNPAKKCRQAASFCRVGKIIPTGGVRFVKGVSQMAAALKRLAETRFLSGLLSCRQRP